MAQPNGRARTPSKKAAAAPGERIELTVSFRGESFTLDPGAMTFGDIKRAQRVIRDFAEDGYSWSDSNDQGLAMAFVAVRDAHPDVGFDEFVDELRPSDLTVATVVGDPDDPE